MRTTLAATLVTLLVGLVLSACGPKQPEQPLLAPDPTEQGQRETKIGTCQWVPPLPADREDVCDRDHDGATLQLVEREDMREETQTKRSFTCSCD